MRLSKKIVPYVSLFFVSIMLLVNSCSYKEESDNRFSTPRKSYDLWIDASLKGDIPATMECLTRNSVNFMKQQMKNRDIFIKRMVGSAKIFNNYSSAKIDIKGDSAVLVLKKSIKQNVINVPFRLEDGEWKVDLIAMFGRKG